jgi:transposase
LHAAEGSAGQRSAGRGVSKAGGGKRAKRRALVGMARKLAVLLHRLWVTGEVYEPLYNRKAAQAAARGKAKAAARGKAKVAA